MTDTLREYTDLCERLAAVHDDSPEAERLRTVMDLVWYRMTPEERAEIDSRESTVES